MRKGFTVFAALVAASLVATPMVIGANNALATPDVADAVTQTVGVAPIVTGPIAAIPAPEGCGRKVRVVYSGYAVTSAGCVAAAR